MSIHRRRARELDCMWEEALQTPPHDTTDVFELAESEGFRPVRVAPPDMFAHKNELHHLASTHPVAVAVRADIEKMRAENEAAHAAIGERIGELDERLSGRIGKLDEKVDSMAEDVARIPQIEAEVRVINHNIMALRDHAGI